MFFCLLNIFFVATHPGLFHGKCLSSKKTWNIWKSFWIWLFWRFNFEKWWKNSWKCLSFIEFLFFLKISFKILFKKCEFFSFDSVIFEMKRAVLQSRAFPIFKLHFCLWIYFHSQELACLQPKSPMLLLKLSDFFMSQWQRRIPQRNSAFCESCLRVLKKYSMNYSVFKSSD